MASNKGDFMFRRSGKNGHDDNATYSDEAPIASPFNKYGAKKNEPAENLQRMFETTPPRLTPLEAHDEQWSNPKTAALPHHFEGMLNEEAPETTLGVGVTFRGQLSFERFLRIDGSFEGDLLSQGKVIIGPTGKVKANLNLREAIIEGVVEGNIVVQEKLELRGAAIINGDIRARSLCVDEGVSINGHVLISAQPEEPAA